MKGMNVHLNRKNSLQIEDNYEHIIRIGRRRMTIYRTNHNYKKLKILVHYTLHPTI